MENLSNGLAAVALGLFLGAAYFNGNAAALTSAIKADKGFLPWLIGVLIFLMLKDYLPDHSGDILFVMLLIIFIGKAGANVFPAINKFLASGKNG